MTKDELPNGQRAYAPVERPVMPNYVTVVYEIVNDEEWGKANPLHYAHNGLKAIGVSRGDLMERIGRLERVCDEYDIDTVA